jgi:hypothetical protein
MARETVSWTDANGVTHTRKVKKTRGLLHMIAFALTGGTSAVVSGPVIASNAAYNAETKRRLPTVDKRTKYVRTSATTNPDGTCKLCDKPGCDGSRHVRSAQ